MAKCAFHPDVETGVTCGNCGRPICPKDMVPTPVGYKCPICAKPERSQYTFVKPRQFVLGGALAALAGIGGAFALAFVLGGGGFLGIIVGYFWGVLTAEAARRGSGGHRGREMAVVAIAAIVIGALLTVPFLGFRMLIPAIAAVVGAGSTLAWSWNG